MKETDYSLILVYYFKRELFEDSETIEHFSSMIDATLKVKQPNAIAYLLPTDDTERIECINPVQVSEADMVRVNEILDNLKEERNNLKHV